MRKVVLVLLLPLLFAFAWQNSSMAAGKWSKVVDRIESKFTESFAAYKEGDIEKAKGVINEAYFNIYELDGMEIAVNKISGERVRTEEHQFFAIKKLMTNSTPAAQVKKEIDELIGMLRGDAAQLDGKARPEREVNKCEKQ